MPHDGCHPLALKQGKMHGAFAQKLSITAAILNCSTRKELCARFRILNPATEFELERSYKWLQGRALPRSPQIYEDWARLLGSQKSGTWLSACSTEAFLDEVCTLFSADHDLVLEEAAKFSVSFSKDDGAHARTEDPSCGTYFSYSWAWSPYQRDRLIRGQLQIAQKRRGTLVADYREQLPGGDLACNGPVHRDGALLQFDAGTIGGGARERITFTLLLPGRPVGVMCGRMQGAIVAGPHSQPSSSRVVLVRGAASASAPGRRNYLDASPAGIAEDLARYLPDRPGTRTLAEAMYRFLTSQSADHVDRISEFDLAILAQGYNEAVEDPFDRLTPGQAQESLPPAPAKAPRNAPLGRMGG